MVASHDQMIDLPSTIAEIGDYVFKDCKKLTSVKLGKDLRTLGDYAFANCSAVKSLTINNNLKQMGKSAFEGCTVLTNVRFPSTLEDIPENAFKNCTSLKSVTFRKGLISIGNNAFSGCSKLTKADLTSTVVTIGDNAFYNCVMLSTELPSNLFSIGSNAFNGCTMLTIINLGKKVSFVGTAAFKNSGARSVTINSKLAKYDANMFDGCKYVVVCVYANAAAYKSFNAKPNLSVVCCEHENVALTPTNATFTSEGIISGYKCLGCGEMTKLKTNACIGSVAFSKTELVYNGNMQQPTIKVTDVNNKTIPATNYTVTYPSGRKNVGKYTAKVTFKGSYSGSKSISYTILPAGTSISSLTADSKKFTVNIKKNTTQTTGYQVQYSTNSSFSGAKTITLNNKTTTKAVSGLSAKKKYYMRVRTYKTVGKDKLYSSWSKAKAVKTK